MSQIKVNTITETTADAGVTVESVLLKDGSITAGASGALVGDTVSERTAAAGVTVDGVRLKDGLVAHGGVVHYHNVRAAAYGAVGDGVTSDSAAVTAAATAANTAGAGAVLAFPPTTAGYNVGASFVQNLGSGVEIDGIARVGRLTQHPVCGTSPNGLVILPHSDGLLNARKGHVFDAYGGRIVYDPGVLVFPGNALPGESPGEVLMCCMIKIGADYRIAMLRSIDDGASYMLSQDILSTGGTTYVDPHMVRLQNGTILCAFHETTSNKITVRKSTDGGQTWTTAGLVGPGAGSYFTEPFLLVVRNNTGSAIAHRVVMVWCNRHPTDTSTRDAYFQTAYSDDEGATWSAPVVVTPLSGVNSAGEIADAMRASLIQTPDGTIHLFYPRKERGEYSQIWHETLDATGASPSGSPVKIADVTTMNSSTLANQFGTFPIAAKGRHGEYLLYCSACDYDVGGTTGELYVFTSTTGALGSYGGGKRISVQTGFGGGYGRIWPCRFTDGRLELLFVGVPTGLSQSRIYSAIHYGV